MKYLYNPPTITSAVPIHLLPSDLVPKFRLNSENPRNFVWLVLGGILPKFKIKKKEFGHGPILPRAEWRLQCLQNILLQCAAPEHGTPFPCDLLCGKVFTFDWIYVFFLPQTCSRPFQTCPEFPVPRVPSNERHRDGL
jgi:hypothetical protein